MTGLNAFLSRTYQAWGAGRIVVSNGDKKEVRMWNMASSIPDPCAVEASAKGWSASRGHA